MRELNFPSVEKCQKKCCEFSFLFNQLLSFDPFCVDVWAKKLLWWKMVSLFRHPIYLDICFSCSIESIVRPNSGQRKTRGHGPSKTNWIHVDPLSEGPRRQTKPDNGGWRIKMPSNYYQLILERSTRGAKSPSPPASTTRENMLNS